MAFRFEDENEDDIGLAVVLSIWLGLFWLVAIVGVHLIFEWIRQAHPEACGARALARAIWEIKLDLALVLFAFALALYLEVIAGTPRFHAGALENVNDGSLSTRVDTWYGGDAQINSYVGIVWNRTRFDFIETLSLTLATFRDGGWFGQSGLSPAPGEPLVAAVHLIEPTVQVSTDGGMSWTGVTHTSNYLTVLDGHRIGGEAHPNPTAATVLFTLNPLVTQINGIRIIGENGGITSSDANGFLGVYELWVDAHPPDGLRCRRSAGRLGGIAWPFGRGE